MEVMICSCRGGVRNLPLLNLHCQNRPAFKSASRMKDCATVELMICRDCSSVFADAMMFIVGSRMEVCAIVELMICRDRALVFADAMMFIAGSKHIFFVQGANTFIDGVSDGYPGKMISSIKSWEGGISGWTLQSVDRSLSCRVKTSMICIWNRDNNVTLNTYGPKLYRTHPNIRPTNWPVWPVDLVRKL